MNSGTLDLNGASLPPCPCGKPWNLDAFDIQARLYVEGQIARLGEMVPVHIGDRAWLVSRRCIAYHGITGEQLLSGASGFTEVCG
jgi:hypothetical protein